MNKKKKSRKHSKKDIIKPINLNIEVYDIREKYIGGSISRAFSGGGGGVSSAISSSADIGEKVAKIVRKETDRAITEIQKPVNVIWNFLQEQLEWAVFWITIIIVFLILTIPGVSPMITRSLIYLFKTIWDSLTTLNTPDSNCSLALFKPDVQNFYVETEEPSVEPVDSQTPKESQTIIFDDDLQEERKRITQQFNNLKRELGVNLNPSVDYESIV
tara:strand:- start:308 stop:955 length:648 start_codon:yes stop_codon:yes gene_type:complete